MEPLESPAVSTDTSARPQMARPIEVTQKAGRERWSPEARTREAVRVLVAKLAPLTEEQKDALRPLLKTGE